MKFIHFSFTLHSPLYSYFAFMKVIAVKHIVLVCFGMLVLQLSSLGQGRTRNNTQTTVSATDDGKSPDVVYDRQGRRVPNRNKGNDSLQKRDQYADSITIYYRYFDSSNTRTLDSSLNDFAKQFQQPYTNINIGNYGSASRSLLFSPLLKAGWDAGFHQFDVYEFTVENSKFYQTTRPFTELAYVLGSKAEQTIHITHTQNKKSNFNFGLEYRFINSPGSFKNQNNNHNNIRLNAQYQSNNRKYGAQLIILSNKHISSENGGLIDAKMLDSLAFSNPFQLDTRIGASGAFSQNPFNTNISTGNRYKNSTIFLRQYYDLGKVDSIYNSEDSVYNKIFYSRVRLQHNLNISSFNYEFIDNNVSTTKYANYFGLNLFNNNNLQFQNKWNIVTNELNAVTFPDKNNQAQFLKFGAAIQNIKGQLGTITTSDYNIYLNGEYRNKTKNKVWDLEATGNLYLNGLNAGDYQAFVSLKRLLGKRIGFLELGFQNVNRTPSTIFNAQNNFFVTAVGINKKENTARVFAEYENPLKHFKLSGEYFLVNNYTYFDSFFAAKQESSVMNVLHISAEKKIKLSKYWNWYIEAHVQQTTANTPINLPLFLTRQRLAFEGNFYTNLFVSTGIELKYYTNYKAANYSPFTGQFFYQKFYTVANRPEINAFLHLRIKSFKAFVRLENINTLIPGNGKYNFSAQQYAQNSMWFRLGIWWNFIN
mgnify:FL=1